MSTAHVIAGIAWDPQIRGFLTLAVGVVVLLGSIYLLLVTNLGVRLGFLIAATAFWGWLFIMGSVWWLYGSVGMLGTLPSWHVKEVVYPTTQQASLVAARDISTTGLPPIADLNKLEGPALTDVEKSAASELHGWKILPEANPSFGEAKAAVDEYFVANPLDSEAINSADDYVVLYSFQRGGKQQLPANPSRVDRLWKKAKTTFFELRSPPHYAIVEVQPVVVQTAVPGAPPPLPKADATKPVISVIMERDLGQRRTPGFLLTVASGIMFGLMASTLHRRDKRAIEVRAMLPATTEA
jgi:hypothetical protein